MDNEKIHADVHYERKDIRLRGLLLLMAGACCLMTILGYAVWRFYWQQESAQEAMKKSPYPLAPGLSTKLPPEPRLEQVDRMAGIDNADVSKRLAEKEKALNGYGPTAENGFVHIPIQQAIKAVAGKLPTRKEPQGPTAADNGLLDAGQSNSGRMFRGPLP